MKMNRKRLLSAGLSLCMLLSLAPVSASAASDHWAQETATSFVEKGWLTGYANGDLGLDDTMTRAQYATVLNQIAGLTETSDKISQYTDVPAGSWFAEALSRALAAGYMNGTSATTMSPNDNVTRQQAFVMVAHLLGLTADEADVAALKAKFPDASSLASYAVEAAAALYKAGYVGGDSKGLLNPTGQMTRAEGITILNNAVPALEELAGNVLKDGVYTGTGAGYGGTIKIQVTVSGGKITDIQILSNSETSAYLNRAKKLLTTILEKQTTEGIDAISGATLSSNGILTAVSACLSQAKGGADTSKTGSTGGGGGGVGAATSVDTDSIDLSKIADDTYSGTATGFYDDSVSVEVTVASHKITKIEITELNDTQGYALSVKNSDLTTRLMNDLNNGNDGNVDAVSGATYSSRGVINAVKKALEGAMSTYWLVDTWPTLTYAVDHASNGDTIKLTANITAEPTGASVTINNTSVTFNGNGYTIKGGTIVIDPTEVTFQNLTMSGSTGPAICVTDGSAVTLTGCTFSGNTGTQVISVEGNGSALTVSDTSFTGNSGSAIYAVGNSSIAVSCATFNNESTSFGSYIRIDGPDVDFSLSGNTYENNTSGTAVGRELTEAEQARTTSVLMDGADKVDGTVTKAADTYVAVWMNIPYADFYKAETAKNTVTVDAFTSATKVKTRTGDLVSGSYHEDSTGNAINGVVFPVLMTKENFETFKTDKKEVTAASSVTIETTNRGTTSTNTYTGKDALFESPDYSYYQLGASNLPGYYKVASYEDDQLIFSQVQGAVQKATSTATISTNSTYGDYQMGISDVEVLSGATVYGVVLETSDGTGYGLRHMENIWRVTELAWCTGFTSAVHDCPTSYEHYESMMGKILTKAIYYTDKGIIEVALNNLYVPKKVSTTGFAVTNAEATANETTVTLSDAMTGIYNTFKVTNAAGTDVTTSGRFNVSDGQLTWQSAYPGKYTLTASDSHSKYVSYSTSFVLSGPAAAVYDDSVQPALKAETNVLPDNFSAYLSNLDKIKVTDNDTDTDAYAIYNASQVINIKTGIINLTAQITSGGGKGQTSTTVDVFSHLEQGTTYDITLTANGYPDLTFTLTVPEYVYYATMNVPYKDFYAAYDLDDKAVWKVKDDIDAVTTATKQKFTDTTGLAKGTYNNGDYIMGVTIPVAMSGETYEKYAENKITDTTAAYYSTALEAVPTAYAVMSSSGGSKVFTKMQDSYINTASLSVTDYTTNGGYGDHQISIEGLDADGKLKVGDSIEQLTIYGAILAITDETGTESVTYGMTCLENMWFGTGNRNNGGQSTGEAQPLKIAWSVKDGQGLKRGHGSGGKFYQFNMNGGTLTSVTLITDQGLIEISCGQNGLKLDKYYTGEEQATAKLNAENAKLVDVTVPEALTNAKVSVYYLDGRATKYIAKNAEITEGHVTVSEDMSEGKVYSVMISSDNYAPIILSVGIDGTAKGSITPAQIAELNNLIASGNAVENPSDTLKSHIAEAEAMVNNEDATYNNAAELITELSGMIPTAK